MPARQIFEAIVYVLRTGIQWKALPKEKFGSPSAIHRYFQEWIQKGFFKKLWKRGLAEYDEMEGVAWSWQSIDGTYVKSPMGNDDTGRNPTDRGKKREQATSVSGRTWSPVVDSRDRSKQA